jgi:predicted  nucleic acid-binding Zn-ribbon protein
MKSNRFDIDAVIGYNKDQLNIFLNEKENYMADLEDKAKHLEYEIAKADDEIVGYIRKVKDLEKDIQHYKERLKDLEEVKVEGKASVSVWKALTALAAAIGALLASVFIKSDDE